jgi:hypothetical protein
MERLGSRTPMSGGRFLNPSHFQETLIGRRAREADRHQGGSQEASSINAQGGQHTSVGRERSPRQSDKEGRGRVGLFRELGACRDLEAAVGGLLPDELFGYDVFLNGAAMRAVG